MGNTCKNQPCCSSEAQKELIGEEAQISSQQYSNDSTGLTSSKRLYDHTQLGASKLEQSVQEQKPILEINQAKEENQAMIQHIRAVSVSSSKDKINETQRVEKLKSLVGKVSNLKLKVISSTILKKGVIFLINPLNLEGTQRKNLDGYIYAGCKKYLKPKKEDFQQPIINDLIIPAKETNEKHRGRHFVIWFDIEKSIYKVKDLGIGYGVFVRLSFPLTLQDNHLINLGESFVVVNLVRDSLDPRAFSDSDGSVLPKLRLKLFGGPSTGEVFYFTGKEQKIVLGRMANCDVQIDDSLLSKYQATIEQKENQWILIDGHDNKPSTNGTWLYLNEEIEIANGMILKTSQTLLLATIQDPNSTVANSGSHSGIQENSSTR